MREITFFNQMYAVGILDILIKKYIIDILG